MLKKKRKKGGDLDWFYNEEQRPEKLRYDPKKEYRKTFRDKYIAKKNKQFGVKNGFKWIALWAIVALAIVGIFILYEPKTEEVVNSLSNLSAPVKFRAMGSVEKVVGDKTAKIEYLEKCTLRGLVSDMQGYLGFKLANRISPMDIGLSWGKLTEYNSDVSWGSPGNRFLYYEFDSRTTKALGGQTNLYRLFSNYHLIPSDTRIKKLMNSMDQGDYVKIEGYVVNVTVDGKDIFYDCTGTHSSDSVGGEVIYVTNITWLKEKEAVKK